MIEELKERAKANLKKQKAFYIMLVMFACTSVILFIISTQTSATERFWINFPTLIYMCVLAVVYVSMFGLRPMREALNEPDEELEKEILHLYDLHTEGLELRDNISTEDKLELEELERLRDKVERN